MKRIVMAAAAVGLLAGASAASAAPTDRAQQNGAASEARGDQQGRGDGGGQGGQRQAGGGHFQSQGGSQGQGGVQSQGSTGRSFQSQATGGRSFQGQGAMGHSFQGSGGGGQGGGYAGWRNNGPTGNQQQTFQGGQNGASRGAGFNQGVQGQGFRQGPPNGTGRQVYGQGGSAGWRNGGPMGNQQQTYQGGQAGGNRGGGFGQGGGRGPSFSTNGRQWNGQATGRWNSGQWVDGRRWDRSRGRWDDQREDRRDFFRDIFAPRRFSLGAYYWPQGYNYRRWEYGETLPYIFFEQNYWLNDYEGYGLEPPPYGCEWVRYGSDALLVDEETGEIIQVVYNIFY